MIKKLTPAISLALLGLAFSAPRIARAVENTPESPSPDNCFTTVTRVCCSDGRCMDVTQTWCVE